MKAVIEFPAAVQMGRDAYCSGVTDIEQAKLANPFKGFVEPIEHAKFVSWNRGWNSTKRECTK